MSNNKIIKWAVLIALAILIGWSWINLAFSFATMLFVAMGLIAVEYMFYMRNPLEVEEDYRRRSFAITLVGCYGLFAIFTMSNYFYPPMEVFSNNDHHAIAVEGIETTNTSLLLAADDRTAFFDDRTMEGRMELVNISHSDSTATLRISGAGMPIYSAVKDKENDEYYYDVMPGQRNIHSWSPNEQLELINNHNQPVAGIRLNYTSKWNYLHFRRDWECTYIIEYRDTLGIHHDTSAFNNIIRTRYPLSKIFPERTILNGVDLSKIELLRPKARMSNSIDDDEDLSKSPFLVCYTKESGLSAVSSGNNTTPVGRTCEIPIRLDGASHFIGLKSRIPGFMLTTDALGHAAIRYRMPLYRYLSTEGYEKGEDGYYTFMLATTLVNEEGEVSSQIPQNVLLYDVFDHVNNIYQMDRQFVSFQRGSTRDSLDLAILDINNNESHIKAEERLPNVGTSEVGTEWIVSLDNFRDPSLARPAKVEKPQSDISFMLFMLVLTGLCCLSLCIRSKYQHTYIEPVAYIILISLVAIRLTLLWRISVFPPSSGITIEEFNKWRTGGNMFGWICGFSYGFVGLIILTKLFGFKDKLSWLKWTNLDRFIAQTGAFLPTFERQPDGNLLWPQGKRALWLLICLGLYVVVFIVGMIWSNPILHVGLPIFVYFATDIVINIQVGSRWTDHGNHSYAFFWQQLMNMLVASGVMFVLDHGYGMIFFVFSLFAMILRLLDLYGGNTYNKNTGEGIRLEGIVGLAVLVVAGTMFMRRIFIGIVTGGHGFLIIVAFAIAIFVAILIWTINSWRREFFIYNISAVVISAGIAVGMCCLFNYMVDNKPTGYRVMVLDDEPSKVLGKVTSTPDMRKFLNASLNDWVLSENIERGKDVNSFIGHKGLDYFKLQPHSNVGVSWMTQLTDLSVSRFIVAEQSNFVPILLIFLFLVMELVAFAFPSDRRWARSLLTQIPLLLAIQSLMVWMAVTRRFIFIGQDFPMISLLSRVNLCVCIIEFLIWIVTAIIEHRDMRLFIENKTSGVNINELEGFIDGESDNKYYRVIRKWTPAFGVCLVVILSFIIYVGESKNHYVSNENMEESTYDVAACVDTLKVLIADPRAKYENIETLFREYQDHYIDSVNQHRSRRNKVYDITALETPQRIVEGFCKMHHYSTEDKNADNPITRVFKRDEEYGPFAQAAFNDFLDRKMYQNDVDELIYIVKRRYVLEEDNENENVRYAFGVTPRYFRQHLPRRTDQAWRGSVKSETAFASNTVERITEGGVVLYTIPDSWTKDYQHGIVVKPTTNRISVIGRYEPRPLARNEAYYLSEGEVLTGTNPLDLSKYGIGNYIARNVFINSQAQFIYPMQSKFYWARPLAEQTRSYMKHSMKEAEGKSVSDSIMSSNAEVTLSINMTRNLADVMERYAQRYNVAVVVADGDGKVRALVEHKKHRYVINPNDARRIEFVDDSLKREGLLNFGNESERYFGNKAILWLDNGPGSSQKPIVWTAVTTQFSGWDWNLLEMAKINAHLLNNDSRYFDATHFAGGRIKKTKKGHFRSIKGDEGSGASEVDLQAYMRKSSNYYNAIMVYIGSHSHADLAMGQPANNPMFTRRSADWLNDNRESSQRQYREELFPLVRFNNAIYSFSRPLNNENVREGILLEGLHQNLGLPASAPNDKKSDLHKSMNNAKRIANYYAFPAISYFNNTIREGDERDVATEGVKMTAIGKNSVWLVSPLKMAEMYGKLVSFNSNYRLIIDPTVEKLPYQAFSTDGDANSYLNMRNQRFIPGLHEVYTNNAQGGTAAGNKIYNKISSNLGDYFIYGKTGTIDGKTDGHDVEDHLLAVIITNRDLATMNQVSDYEDENFRFYIIYIADFDHKHYGTANWLTVDPEIINTVLQSEEFNKYMEGN